VGGVSVEMATPEDEAALRRLLRENPMAGEIAVSFEREPSALLAARVEGEPHHTVVARDRASGAVVGMGSRAVWNAFVDGAPCRLGYLAQLRLDHRIRARGRGRLVAAGYRLLDERRGPDEAPFDLTSIVADNRGARRLLESNVPGLPRYRELGRFSTLILPARRRRRPGGAADLQGTRVERGSDARVSEVAACLERNRRRYQVAPFFTEEELRSPQRSRGLAPEHFHLALRGEAVVGCVAVWDQRAFKQVVVRGYAPRLARWRPLLNAAGRWLGTPPLPATGEALPHAYVSHLAVDGDDLSVFQALLEHAHADACDRRLGTLLLGLAAGHPWIPWVRRRFRPREYSTILYTVHWDGGGAFAAPTLGEGCLPHLEVALL
jgi:hypothetical protein